jgi:hypothetical protein
MIYQFKEHLQQQDEWYNKANLKVESYAQLPIQLME